jgi:lipid-A-disaccharide synthase
LQKIDCNNNAPIKAVIITGELSGEIHASHLVDALNNSMPFEFSGMGSTRLQEVGVRIIYDYSNISVTGISEIFGKLKYIREAYNIMKCHLIKEKPALLIIVDFPGFNLKIAQFAKKHGVPVIYFIPPQVWAWRRSRIRKIRDRVNRVLCILPFEKKLYEEYDVDVAYVGHPFFKTVRPAFLKSEFYQKLGVEPQGPVITILPGSRVNEVHKHMPILLAIIEKLKEQVHQPTVLLPLAENIEPGLVQKYVTAPNSIKIFKGMSHDAIAHSDLALAASGSVTLEAAILGTPTVVIYRISVLSYLLAKILVDVKYISLPNIIANKEIFPEFIQQLDPEKIAEKALYMLKNGREGIKDDIKTIRDQFSNFDSYNRARDEIVLFLRHIYGSLPKTPSVC